MKALRVLILVGLVGILLPSQSQAFDGERHGFMLGLGAGMGSAKVEDESESGIATAFKIGGGVNNQLLVYYSNRVVFFKSTGSPQLYQGMSALGASYFLAPEAPSLFFTGELGAAVLASLESGYSSYAGFGLGLGMGYEFGRHWAAEINYMSATVGEYDASISNLMFTVTWTGY